MSNNKIPANLIGACDQIAALTLTGQKKVNNETFNQKTVVETHVRNRIKDSQDECIEYILRLLEDDLSSLGLSHRVHKMLHNKFGIRTVSGLEKRAEADLAEAKGMGPVALKEIREKLAEKGKKLSGE